MHTPESHQVHRPEVRFPAGFVWGSATAAFQVEGATTADGRGTSIWDTFAARPGRIVGGDTGEPATDHYRRYPEDIALMRELGLGSYRFSIAWPRVLPAGKGAVNRAGLDFYDRLIDGLLAAGIEPWPTLYHWDLPQTLEDAGGWTRRDTAQRFAEYAAVVQGAFGDRVTHWTTLNEPWCSAYLGYVAGEHAPGRTDVADGLAAAHHLLLGHGLAAQAIRAGAAGGREQRVGLVHNQGVVRPYRDTVADHAAARTADGVRNRLYTDPVLHGRYPEDVRERFSGDSDFAFLHPGDLAVIAAPLDHLGLNFYGPQWVAGAAGGVEGIDPSLVGGTPAEWAADGGVVPVRRGLARTAMGWEIDASGLYEALVRLATESPGTDLYVTENGAAFDDEVAPDGGVHDTERTAYLDAHLRAAHAAIASGVPLKGYFAWSLMDNFEWAFGYSKRFGIVHVDYDTQCRTVKDSGHWFAGVARTGVLPG
nr:GH1 family beta-glucosidase [Murinocardiopsis flavida]